LAQKLANLDHVTLVLGTSGQDASLQGRNLDRYLVRFELDERFAGRDAVPVLLEPPGYRGFDDRFAKGRDFDLYHLQMSRTGVKGNSHARRDLREWQYNRAKMACER